MDPVYCCDFGAMWEQGLWCIIRAWRSELGWDNAATTDSEFRVQNRRQVADNIMRGVHLVQGHGDLVHASNCDFTGSWYSVNRHSLYQTGNIPSKANFNSIEMRMQALDDGQGDKMEEASKAGLFAPSYICPGYLRPRSKEINDHDISLNVSLSYEKKTKKKQRGSPASTRLAIPVLETLQA